MGGPGYSPPHPVKFSDPADYAKVLRHAYNFHARMINKGWLSADGAHTVAQTEDTPDEFGYWQSRLTKHDVAKHYASAVFAIHKAHFSYNNPWSISDSEMKHAQAELAGGEQHLPNVVKFAKNFAARLSSQGKNYDTSSIGSQFDSESDVVKDVNSDIYKFIKEEMEFEAEQEYGHRLAELYHEHMGLSKDPESVFQSEPESTQMRMTRTPVGHHYAAVTYAIQRSHHESEWKSVPREVKKAAQEELAGGPDHLQNVKRFAMHFQSKEADANGVQGFPPIKPEAFFAEEIMTLRQLINAKLTILSETFDDKYFSDNGRFPNRKILW